MPNQKENDKRQPLYYQLAVLLENMIASGTLPVGFKFLPEDEMALEYKVSRQTLRQTLDKLARDGYIVRLKSKGTFVVHQFKVRRVIGIVMQDSWSGSMPDGIARTFGGIIQRAGASNCEVRAFCMSELDDVLEKRAAGDCDLCGIIFLRYRDFFKSYLERCDKLGLPFVLEGALIPAHYCVDVDNAHAMKTAVDYLFSLGHRKFGIATTLPQSYPFSDHLAQREKSALACLKQKRCLIRDEWFLRLPGGNVEDCGAILKEFFQSPGEKPTAFICTTDLTAVHLINTAGQCGIHVPADLSVTGFDNMPEIYFYKPSLTTFHQDSNRLGAECVELLLEISGNWKNRKIQRILKPGFLIRKSCAPISNNKEKI